MGSVSTKVTMKDKVSLSKKQQMADDRVLTNISQAVQLQVLCVIDTVMQLYSYYFQEFKLYMNKEVFV